VKGESVEVKWKCFGFVAAVVLSATFAGAAQTWQKALGGTSDDAAYGVAQTSDGGYIVAGYTESFGAGGSDMYLVKVDTSGTLQWQKTFGGPGDEGVRTGTSSGTQWPAGSLIRIEYTVQDNLTGEDFYSYVRRDSDGQIWNIGSVSGANGSHSSQCRLPESIPPGTDYRIWVVWKGDWTTRFQGELFEVTSAASFSTSLRDGAGRSSLSR